MQHYPTHLAIIPDGNRTWATDRGLPAGIGHLEGKKRTQELLEYVFEHTPIKIVTIRGLSTENTLQRSAEEKDTLYDIYQIGIEEMGPLLRTHQINLKRAGSPNHLPANLVELFHTAQKEHTYPTQKYLFLAINYGGRDEIIRAVQARDQQRDHAQPLTEDLLSSYMDFGAVPPVELVVRTKGGDASRTSGFMSWWIGYAELYFTTTKFPDFDIEQLNEALAWFDTVATKRNFGK